MGKKDARGVDPISLAQAQGAGRGGCQTCKSPVWSGTVLKVLNAMLLPVSDARHVDLYYSAGQMLALLRQHFDYPWKIRALEKHMMGCEHELWGKILEQREDGRNRRS